MSFTQSSGSSCWMRENARSAILSERATFVALTSSGFLTISYLESWAKRFGFSLCDTIEDTLHSGPAANELARFHISAVIIP